MAVSLAKFKWGLAAVAVLGLAVTIWLILRVGFSEVWASVLAIGAGGFVLFSLLSLVIIGLLGMSWWLLFPTGSASLPVAIWGRLVRESAGELLPFSQLGGFVLGVRAIVIRGIAGPIASASIVVDLTAELMAQIAYTALGIGLLLSYSPDAASARALVVSAAAGVAIAVPLALIFMALQRRGAGLAQKLADRFLPAALVHTKAFNEALGNIYAAPARLVSSTLLHLFSWIASGVATWAAFRLMGLKVDVAAVLAVESIVYGARSLGFMVPSGVGVQEVAYAAIAPLVGIPAEAAVALSLIKRGRDVAIGAPALLIWQGMEGRRAAHRARRGEALRER